MDTSSSSPREDNHYDINIPSMKTEILEKAAECQQRGLTHSFKWLSEILYALRSHGPSNPTAKVTIEQEVEVYYMAKSYFDLKEYDRCAFFTESQSSPLVKFLHHYSKYLAGEKQRLDGQTDIIVSNSLSNLDYLKDLRSELNKMYIENSMDGYILYLYGLVLKKLNLKSEARRILVEAVWKEPCLWSGKRALI